MTDARRFTFKKQERICSKLLIDKLFGGGKSHSMVAFPLRAVYWVQEKENKTDENPQIKILISVPKKHFKRAVKRNRAKRQIREAYRKNKYLLLDELENNPQKEVLLAFIWLDNQLHETEAVEIKVQNLLQRIAEKIEKERKEDAIT